MLLVKDKHQKSIKKSIRRNRVDVLGVKIDNVDLDEAVNRIASLIASGSPHLVVTPYSESIVVAGRDPEFRRILNEADLVVPDGVGLKAAATYLALPAANLVQAFLNGLKVGWWVLTNQDGVIGLKARVPGVDLVQALCRKASKNNWRVFLLGGRDDVAQKAAGELKKRYPGVIVAAFAGSRDVGKETETERTVAIERLNEFKPDLLFVAYGPVKQEKWLSQNLEDLNAKVAIGVGGSFDYLAGSLPRAPRWLRARGLEWLYRLVKEPKRLRRQLRIPQFVWMVFQSRLKIPIPDRKSA